MPDQLAPSLRVALEEVRACTQSIIEAIRAEDVDTAAANGELRDSLIRELVKNHLTAHQNSALFIAELQALKNESDSLTASVKAAMAKVMAASGEVSNQRKAIRAYDNNSAS